MVLKQAVRDHTNEFVRSMREGDGWPTEADDTLNDSCRNLIAAMAEEHGGCWLGKINLYDDERHGGAPVLWKWDGEMVYNFGCAFVVPQHDAELERLICERDNAEYTTATADVARIDAIFKRLAVLGGQHLFWT